MKRFFIFTHSNNTRYSYISLLFLVLITVLFTTNTSCITIITSPEDQSSSSTQTTKSESVRLIGSAADTANVNASGANYVHYVKFTAASTGKINTIKIYSSAAGKIKVAVYSHSSSGDAPQNKLNSNDVPTSCVAGKWNNVSIPATSITSGTIYWLAFNADTEGLVMNGPGNSVTSYKSAPFANYVFPAIADSDLGSAKFDISIAGWNVP